MFVTLRRNAESFDPRHSIPFESQSQRIVTPTPDNENSNDLHSREQRLDKSNNKREFDVLKSIGFPFVSQCRQRVKSTLQTERFDRVTQGTVACRIVDNSNKIDLREKEKKREKNRGPRSPILLFL